MFLAEINIGMGNINGIPGKKITIFGAIIDSHCSRRVYFIQMV